MWGLLADIGIGLTLWGINRYLEDPGQVRKPDPQKFDIPTTAEGIAIPVVYGTCRVDNPVLVWAGNLRADDASSLGVPYAYGASMLFVVGVPTSMAGPRTVINRIWWGDIPVDVFDANHPLTEGVLTGFTVNNGTVMGVQGQIQMHRGSTTQNVGDSSTLAYAMMTRPGPSQVDGTLIPGFRNQIVVAIDCSRIDGTNQWTVGSSPTLPQISFEVSSLGPDHL